jgi:hypothetical protein
LATHTVHIIDHKQLSDGKLALLAECCGEKSTHSWLTMAAEVVVDDAQYQNSINYHVNHVAHLHEAMKQAITKAKATVGSSISVTPSTSSAAEDILKSLVGTVRQVDPVTAPLVQ